MTTWWKKPSTWFSRTQPPLVRQQVAQQGGRPSYLTTRSEPSAPPPSSAVPAACMRSVGTCRDNSTCKLEVAEQRAGCERAMRGHDNLSRQAQELRSVCAAQHIPIDGSEGAEVLYQKCVYPSMAVDFDDMEYLPSQDWFWRAHLIRYARKILRRQDVLTGQMAELSRVMQNPNLSTANLQQYILTCPTQSHTRLPLLAYDSQKPPTCPPGYSFVTQGRVDDWDTETQGPRPSIGCCISDTPLPVLPPEMQAQLKVLSPVAGNETLSALDTDTDAEPADDERSQMLKKLSDKAGELWATVQGIAVSEQTLSLIYEIQKYLEVKLTRMSAKENPITGDSELCDVVNAMTAAEAESQMSRMQKVKRVVKQKGFQALKGTVMLLVKNKYVLYLISTQIMSIMEAACMGIQKDFLFSHLSIRLSTGRLSEADLEELIDDYVTRYKLQIIVHFNYYIMSQLQLDDVQQSLLDYVMESDMVKRADRWVPLGIFSMLTKPGIKWLVELISNAVVDVVKGQIQNGIISASPGLEDYIRACLQELKMYRKVIPLSLLAPEKFRKSLQNLRVKPTSSE